MELTKRYIVRQKEEGWLSAGDKYFCTRYFPEDAICDFIKVNLAENTCSYCGEEANEPIAAEIAAKFLRL